MLPATQHTQHTSAAPYSLCCCDAAGPLFDSSDAMSFYNLELSDTNVVDHNTHDYAASNNTTFTVLEC